MIVKKNLVCHGETPCTALQRLIVEIEALPEGSLGLLYELMGDLNALSIPAPQPAKMTDGLWQHTCFEAFIAIEGSESYHEFNFSPSGQWAAYAFGSYRKPIEWADAQAPGIHLTQADGRLLLKADIPAADLPPNPENKPFQLGLTAVVETRDGLRSYWALHHPAAQPDFHRREGFVLSFPPSALS